LAGSSCSVSGFSGAARSLLDILNFDKTTGKAPSTTGYSRWSYSIRQQFPTASRNARLRKWRCLAPIRASKKAFPLPGKAVGLEMHCAAAREVGNLLLCLARWWGTRARRVLRQCANICSQLSAFDLQLIVSLGPIWHGVCTLSGGKQKFGGKRFSQTWRSISMKNALFILCLLCATRAFGQYLAISSESQRIEVPSHELHASQQPMGEEKTLLGTSYNVHGQGVRPLWELAPVRHEVPLGDTARMLKQQHAAAKKAEIIWEN
jgi:hypothetical protein